MNPTRWAGIVLVVAGVLGLVYGGFSYTSQTHQAQLGPMKMSISEKKEVNVPMWAGTGALVAGLLLLVWGVRKP